MKKKVLYFILSLNGIIQAQNLVLNPSFESYTACPNSLSQINRCNSWNDGDKDGTCDYYSALGCVGNFSPPIIKPTGSLTIYQKALSGKSYAGFIPYYSPGFSLPSYVEFLQGQFSSPLNSSQLYYIEFYVNSASQMKYFINDIAALITDTAGWINTGNLLSYTPQILPMPNTIYRDTTKWMRINGYYTANGGENYITIGNYKPNGQETKDSTFSIYNETYYFVDSVGVYPVTHLDPWNAGPDKTINSGDSVQIGNPNTDYSMFSWTISTAGKTYLTDSTDSWPYAKPSQNTTYYVTKTQGSNVFKDTINVFVNGSGINSFSNAQIFSVYPNPSNGNFTLRHHLKENAVLEITDVNGNLVDRYNIPAINNMAEIKNDKLQSGIYLYRVISNGEMLKIGKIVVMK